jgi:hypothetical protein
MKSAPWVLAMSLIFFAGKSAAAGEFPKLAAADRQHILAAKEVKPLKSMKEIPPEVVQACKGLGGYKDFELADPGQAFQATDVITEKHLLGRRLMWAVSFPGYVVIHYESGGIAHMFHVVVVEEDSAKKAHVLWETDARPGTSNTFEEFQRELAAGKFDHAAR